MNNVLETIKLGENSTIKSVELVEIINWFRKLESETTDKKYRELAHYDFYKKITNELKALKTLGLNNDGNISVDEYLDKKGENRPCYKLNKDGMLQMLNSESIYCRAKTIEYINRLESENKRLKELISEEQKLQLAIFNADSKENAILASADLDRYRKNQLKEKDEIIGIQKPKADYTDLVLKSEGLVTITQIAKDYGYSGQAFNKILHDLKIQYKQSNQWLLYSKYDNLGWTHSETYLKGNNTYVNTKWTQNGRMGLYELLKKNNIVPTMEKLKEENKIA